MINPPPPKQPEIEPGERQAIENMFDFARQQGWMTGPSTK